MKNDPIVEEIHKIREQYAQRFNFNLDAMFADLKMKEQQTNWCKVVRKPKFFLVSELHSETSCLP